MSPQGSCRWWKYPHHPPPRPHGSPPCSLLMSSSSTTAGGGVCLNMSRQADLEVRYGWILARLGPLVVIQVPGGCWGVTIWCLLKRCMSLTNPVFHGLCICAGGARAGAPVNTDRPQGSDGAHRGAGGVAGLHGRPLLRRHVVPQGGLASQLTQACRSVRLKALHGSC
jgi:hypothetical protein